MKSFIISIRLKILLATLIPLLTVVALSWFIGNKMIKNRMYQQALEHVITDLNAARELLWADLMRIENTVRLTSLSPPIIESISAPPNSRAVTQVETIIKNEGLAFLTITDRFGNISYRGTNPSSKLSSKEIQSILKASLKGKTLSGLIVLTSETAALENPELPSLMRIKLLKTPHAREYIKDFEDRGMYLFTSTPIVNLKGEITGSIYGAKLLNREVSLIERIMRVVFESSGKVRGNTTIFLDDVRIATSIKNRDNSKAIGTTMSEEVYRQISAGEKWEGRGFVVDSWHITAYYPLKDIFGEVIGSIYAGVPEAPLNKIGGDIQRLFTIGAALVTFLGIILSIWISSRVSRPVMELADAAKRVGEGENLPDISVGTNDEIASLAKEFNMMKNRLESRKQEILSLNQTLENRVEQRTDELRIKGEELLTAQIELSKSEKLAGLGLLAAGVAHEINNPLAIIRGNAELISVDNPESEEPEIIIAQAIRIEKIVKGLLALGRDSKLSHSPVDVAVLVQEILDQIHHQHSTDNYRVKVSSEADVKMVNGDEGKVRQIFTNLVINSFQAMPSGGDLEVCILNDNEGEMVTVSLSDSGEGIPDDKINQIFTPFYTTKSGGTGLGLAVTYSLVKEHGGEIMVTSKEGVGSIFTVKLPAV